ncbi:uncharacterized protein [Engystomops pustulosus]|uniref:uncharacterized protein n=1 Tax=Engystomops pustulosus TaxID=76066 RepID=UPI003AFA8B99
MKFLWTSLLLAFAIDSVYSNGCRRVQDHTPVVKETLTHACGPLNGLTIANLQIDSIPLGGLLQGVISVVNNVLISNVNILEVRVSDTPKGLGIHAQINLHLGCDRFKDVSLTVTIDANLDLDLQNGAIVYKVAKDLLKIEITLNEQTLSVSKLLVNAVLKPVTVILKSLLAIIVDTVCLVLNNGNRIIVDRAFLVGKTLLSFELTEAKMIDGNPNAKFCIKSKDEKVCPQTLEPITPKDDEGIVMEFPTNIMKKLVELSLETVVVEIYLDPILISKEEWYSKYPNTKFSIRLSISGLKNLQLKEEESDLGVVVHIELVASGKVIVDGTAEVNLKTRAGFAEEHLSLAIGIGGDIKADVKVGNDDGQCACKSVIKGLLEKLLNLHLSVLVSEMNCNTKKLVPVLPVSGPPPHLHEEPTPTLPPVLPGAPAPTPPKVLPKGKCAFHTDKCTCSRPPTK